MTIAMEVMVPAKDTGAFGGDGIYWPFQKILLLNISDTNRVVFGPVVISWNGRVLQVPVMAKPSIATGNIHFQIINGNKKSELVAFEIVQPQSKISITGGGAELGDGTFAKFSFNGLGNTIVADEIEFSGSDFINKGLFTFSKEDNDTSISGNPHYHPVTLLSRGPINLKFAELSVSADSLNGGPGGGGGGHGFSGTGGAGYTGGGSDSAYSPNNVGSGGNSTSGYGGPSSTGVNGGISADPNSDQGGGGGTGCPYGSSGVISGALDTSKVGGYGGGSAGGEASGLPYGGGGGAFATNGEKGAGIGNNGGRAYGGRFLLPMQGGSGGGSGNDASLSSEQAAGSGSGGGGALTIISFDTLSVINSSLTANGSQGSGGISANEAGGGGGSGGGLLLSARNGVSFNNSIVSSTGGSGGLGGLGIELLSKGGAGGIGRIRIDGDTLQTNFSTSNSIISGPTLNIPTGKLNGPFAVISGTAGDSLSLTDSIRVYYRNHHTGWKFLDTLRFKYNKGKYIWRALLPMGHDSSLFVTAMAQVRNPNHDVYNSEPERLLSHLSSGIIRVKATPHLVLLQDTLIFGCFKINEVCDSANFYISNQGEEKLAISSITISNPNFTILRKVDTLGFYLTDSIRIKYCPSKVGKDTAIITFESNDGTHTAILIGCGIDKDTKIVLKPAILDFGKVSVGKCDTLQLTAFSIGKDSALLSSLYGLSRPPFEIVKPVKDTLLAPKDSIHIVIRFCPEDTGNFRSSFVLSEKRDSVIVFGRGIRKVLIAEENIPGKILCVDDCDSIKVRFSSNGTDAVTISGITGASLVAGVLPIIIPPQTDTEFTFRFCAVQGGDATIEIKYISDADSSNSTLLHYHGIKPQFAFDSVLHFNSLCLSSQDSLPFNIRRIGSDSITIVSLSLKNTSQFSLSGETSARPDSAHVMVHFIPTTSGSFSDTLLVQLHLGQCGDSLIKIPIDGSASSGKLVFSKTSISFGSLDTGLCKEDTMIVSNPCKDPVTVIIPSLAPPFFVTPAPNTSLIVTAGNDQKIIYSYCPTAIGSSNAEHIFLSLPDNDTITLSGEGLQVIDSPFVRFKLAKIGAIAGNEFSYFIEVDSISSGTNIRSLDGTLHFDPTVVKPITMSGVKWNIPVSVETTPGTYNFSANSSDSLTKGPFATLQMLALYGPRDTTSVFLEITKISDYSSVAVIPGFITVSNCGNTAGNIIVAGDYSLGNPTPNPSNGSISIPVLLGIDGILHIRMYNASGMMALDRSEALKRGKNTITFDVSLLPSGIYYLAADSWGWREGRTLIIQK